MKEEAVDRILGELALDLLQQVAASAGIHGIVQRADQCLELRIGVTEVISIARVDVVVHGLGMTDDGHVEVMARIDLIEPLRPFEIFDPQANTGLGELRRDDLAAAPGVAWRRQFQVHGKAVRIAGLRQERTGCGHAVGVLAGQIHVSRIVRREVAADGRAVSVHRAVDDGATVERVRDGTAYQQVVQWCHALVEREDGFHFGGAVEYGEARIGGELREALRRRVVREGIDVARHQGRIGCGGFGDELERDFVQRGRRTAEIRIAYESQRIAAPPDQESKWARAHRMHRVTAGRLRRDHDEGAECQGLEQRSRAAAQCQLDRCRIDDRDVADGVQLGSLCIDRARGDDAVQGELGGFGIEGRAILEARVFDQVKDIGEAVVRDGPGLGQARQHGAVRGKLHQSFVHVSIQALGDRGRRIGGRVEDGRFELHPDDGPLGRVRLKRNEQ